MPLACFDDGSGMAVFAAADLPDEPWGVRDRIAKWNGLNWQILDKGIPPLNFVERLCILDDGGGPRLYASVSDPTFRVYLWDGTSWEAPPAGFETGSDWPYCSYDDGTGPAIYGVGEGGIKKWDGAHWNIIGLPLGTAGFVLNVFDLGDGPSLYFYGAFSGMQGVPNTRGIARWDGQQWHALGTGVVGAALEACVFDAGQGKELYIAGGLFSAGGIPAKVAKWNGQQWSAVPFPSEGAIDQMVVFDDGFGPALVAKGPVSLINGQVAHGFVKFDGQNWHAMPGAGNANPNSEMVVFNQDPRGPSIFMFAGGGTADLAQFVGCAGGHSCYPDCDNADGKNRLTANDFICFINRYTVTSFRNPTQFFRDPYVDCNLDTFYNAADFQCFLTKFAAGCP